jgi:hypothetical protein
MRRPLFLIVLLAFTGSAASAMAQDSTRRDTTRRDSTWQDTTHRRVHKRVPVTSPGEVDTSKFHKPTRRDSALVRREMRPDSASTSGDTAARPSKPPADTLPPKKNPERKPGSPGNQYP